MNHARRQGHRVYAALYDRMTGPLEQGVLGTRRSALLAGLPGEVLDVGAGTGANLPHFRNASRVVAAEPGPAMRRRMAAKLPGTPVPVQLTSDAAEALHHPDASFDAVVFTLALCTVTYPPGTRRGAARPPAGRPADRPRARPRQRQPGRRTACPTHS